MENQHTDDLSRILRTVEEILEIVHFMKDHRNQLEGDPILDFAEVCQLLRQSERQVRRFREQGLLVGFNIVSLSSTVYIGLSLYMSLGTHNIRNNSICMLCFNILMQF